MHDARGKELKVGDVVLIPARITSLSCTPDYCNICVETLGGRLPDGERNSIGYLNARQVYRANAPDDQAMLTYADGSGPDGLIPCLGSDDQAKFLV